MLNDTPIDIPLKLLFQHQHRDTYVQWRLTVLVSSDTLKQMLQKLETDPKTPVTVTSVMPEEHLEVHLEVFNPKNGLSGLAYTKHLMDHEWHTNHVTLVGTGSGSPVE